VSRSIFLALALMCVVSACSQPISLPFARADLCKAVSAQEASAALGSVPQQIVNQSATGSPHPECTWTTGDYPPRMMTAAIWREDALVREGRVSAGEDFFAAELAAMERDFAHVRVVNGIGEAAVMGVGDLDGERFTGGILARKGQDVLALRIDGADPAAFEAVARKLADAF
jgi:hypothetical protein